MTRLPVPISRLPSTWGIKTLAITTKSFARKSENDRVASLPMLDTGCWILDAGYWILDAGCWMQNAERET
jgi:hypothetical protein